MAAEIPANDVPQGMPDDTSDTVPLGQPVQENHQYHKALLDKNGALEIMPPNETDGETIWNQAVVSLQGDKNISGRRVIIGGREYKAASSADLMLTRKSIEPDSEKDAGKFEDYVPKENLDLRLSHNKTATLRVATALNDTEKRHKRTWALAIAKIDEGVEPGEEGRVTWELESFSSLGPGSSSGETEFDLKNSIAYVFPAGEEQIRQMSRDLKQDPTGFRQKYLTPRESTVPIFRIDGAISKTNTRALSSVTITRIN
ncbi:hypothetical protein JW710_00250 [Candidatus Dojkabacteria bacterium]|nr:hypothetical protein [Candidatus Dojkabacteria bacterium]